MSEEAMQGRYEAAEDLLRDWLRGGECFCSDYTANRGPCEFCKTMEYFQEKTPYPPATLLTPIAKAQPEGES